MKFDPHCFIRFYKYILKKYLTKPTRCKMRKFIRLRFQIKYRNNLPNLIGYKIEKYVFLSKSPNQFFQEIE